MPTRADALATIQGAQFQRVFKGNLNVVSVDVEVVPRTPDYRLRVGVRSLDQEARIQALGSDYAVPAQLDLVSAADKKVIKGKFISVRTFEEGEIEALSLVHPTGPCPPGYSIGHPNVTAGTFGCLLQYDGQPDHRFILSNNHVLAVSNLATIGDVIIQPGTADGGTLNGRIGKLSAFKRLEYAVNNKVDAAIARVERDAPEPVTASDWGTLVKAEIPSIGTPIGFRNATQGRPVVKVGRTSHKTHGTVEETSAPLTRVNYGPGLGYITFENQIRTGLMGLRGDSGSVLLEVNEHSGEAYIVGLLFSGSNVATYFNPIEDVLRSLETELGGGTFSVG